MGTVDIFKSKSDRFCYSYFYAKFFSKRRKSRDIPGTSANQTRRLPLTADQLFHRIRKGLPDVVCFLGCLWKQLSVHGIMIPYVLATFFLRKLKKGGIKFRFCCQKKRSRINLPLLLNYENTTQLPEPQLSQLALPDTYHIQQVPAQYLPQILPWLADTKMTILYRLSMWKRMVRTTYQ